MRDIISIKVLSLGEQAANCYIIWSKKSGQGFVIDPADSGDIISQFLLDEKIALKGILLTHGHFDHLLALLELQLNFPVPTYMHADDQFLVTRAQTTAVHFLGRAVDPIPPITNDLVDAQRFTLGEATVSVLHTPGHTPGSVCFMLESEKGSIEIDGETVVGGKILFTGDTLFSYGIEPLTHSYSNALKLSASLKKIRMLGKNILIFPGHGEISTIDDSIHQSKSSNNNVF
ncbi:MBL fold metallo-hydrolase [Candidatus Woesebacteria bacterium]|nr:MBL fold metallo-hydrolase [Candidatus Woesebacteria bacterium]